MPPTAEALNKVRQFKARLAAAGLAPEELILHGSHARGDAHPESDFDLLLIYPEITLPLRSAVYALGAEMMRETGEFYDTLLMSHHDAYESPERGSIFMINVYDDGIAV